MSPRYLFVLIALSWVGAARATTSAYVLEGGDSLLQRYAPIFLVEQDEKSCNKIGTPAARTTEGGQVEVYVDSSHPTIYTDIQHFDTEKDRYTNLIYRIHFERNPFTMVPLNVGAGRNVGAIAVITLNGNNEPVWLTTVQSCGCYHAILPTDYLPEASWKDGWDPAGCEVYGEHLPGLLRLRGVPEGGHIAITIRGDNHRTMGVEVAHLTDLEAAIPVVHAAAAPVEALKHLPLPAGGETSFYHTTGGRKGLVKGAWKPLETALFGLWAWDHNVGQDREYGPKEEAGRRFYTTLFFKRKKASDMWDYAHYLEHNGWKP